MSADLSTTLDGTPDTAPRWRGWLDRWDRQQEAYLPVREDRFDVMCTVVAALHGESAHVLDLACGPGSISQRFLTRFPRARSTGIDVDPVLLALGERVLGDLGGRLRLVHGDLTDPGWPDLLPGGAVDAVLTTTALHYLTPGQLARLYRQLAELLAPGAVLLNGDHMGFGADQPTLRHLAETAKQERRHGEFAVRGVEDYDQWWAALEAYSDTLAPPDRLPFDARRPPHGRSGHRKPDHDTHVAALRDAGFAEIGTVWAHLDNRVLVAVR